jgi:hypothetical protein
LGKPLLAMRPDDLRGRAIFLDSFDSVLRDCVISIFSLFPV